MWRTDPLTEARENIYMQELWFLCMAHSLNVLYKCMKFCWNTSNCYQVIERTQNIIANYLREINSKISKAELWFLCMTRRLNVLYKCMKFRWNTSNSFQVIEQTPNSIANDKGKISKNIHCGLEVFKNSPYRADKNIGFSYVTRGIIWKTNMQALWFLCMTCHLNVLYKCMKFRWNTSYTYQVIERTQNIIANYLREINSKNIQSRVMVLVHDISS